MASWYTTDAYPRNCFLTCLRFSPLPTTVTPHAPHFNTLGFHSAPTSRPTLKAFFPTIGRLQMIARPSLPPPHIGYIYLATSALLLAVGTHAILLGALFSGPAAGSTSVTALNALERDGHYKYLALFSVPVCAYFVIANWVGWQFFRNS